VTDFSSGGKEELICGGGESTVDRHMRGKVASQNQFPRRSRREDRERTEKRKKGIRKNRGVKVFG